MFLVKCLVDDKHISTVLHRLAGIANNVLPVPIANAKRVRKNGTVETEGETLYELVYNKLPRKRLVSKKTIKLLIQRLGRPPSSVDYVIKELIKRDQLMSLGNGQYRMEK